MKSLEQKIDAFISQGEKYQVSAEKKLNGFNQKLDNFIEATNNRFDTIDKKFNQLNERFDQVDFKIEETKKDLKEDITEVARQGKKTHELLEIVATQTKAHDSEIIAKHQNYTELEERVHKLEKASHIA